MLTKHFFKALVIFIIMIALGLVGVLFSSGFGDMGYMTGGKAEECTSENC
jgi:preprotein translocase subunit SecG